MNLFAAFHIISSALFCSVVGFSAVPAHAAHHHHDEDHDHDHNHDHDTVAEADSAWRAAETRLEELIQKNIAAIERGELLFERDYAEIGKAEIDAAGYLSTTLLLREMNQRELVALGILKPRNVLHKGAQFAFQLGSQFAHLVSHWNPISLGKRMISAVRQRGLVVGAAIAIGFAVTETTEALLALLAARIFDQHPALAALLLTFSGSHGGEIIGGAIAVTIPRYVESVFRNGRALQFSPGAGTLGEVLKQRLKHSRIDWTLNPYFVSEDITAKVLQNLGPVIVVPDSRHWHWIPRRFRPISSARLETQKKRFPTLTLEDLASALEEIGENSLQKPKTPIEFRSYVATAIHKLLSNDFGRELLKYRISKATTVATEYDPKANPSSQPSHSPQQWIELLASEGFSVKEQAIPPSLLAKEIHYSLTLEVIQWEKYLPRIAHSEFFKLVQSYNSGLKALVDELEASYQTYSTLQEIALRARKILINAHPPDGFSETLKKAYSESGNWDQVFGLHEKSAPQDFEQARKRVLWELLREDKESALQASEQYRLGRSLWDQFLSVFKNEKARWNQLAIQAGPCFQALQSDSAD